VIFEVKCGFQGLLGAAEPRQMRTVVQKIGRLVLRMFCRKSTCTDFGGGGLVQAVLERPSGRW
jgi:hypothetical protein